jgi:1-deoxy-D-xylulose-5-phosphate synthase
MAPKDENELRHMLKTAISLDTPASVRYPRGKGVGVPLEAPKILETGRAEIIKDGSDLAIFAIGSTVYPALAAAGALEKEGIRARVVNCRFVKPLDAELLVACASSLQRVLTVEENVLMGGFGAAVLELLEERGVFGVKVMRLGITDEFVEHATQDELRAKYGIDESGIAEAARKLMKK